MIDLLIKNGTVFDGTGKEPFQADIGIAGDKIAFVNKKTGVKGSRGQARKDDRCKRACCCTGIY